MAGTCCFCWVTWPGLTQGVRIRQRSGTKQPLAIFSLELQPHPSQNRGLNHPGSGAALLFKLFLPTCVINLLTTVVIQFTFSFFFSPLCHVFPFCHYSACSDSSLFPKCNGFLSIIITQMCKVIHYD